MKGPGDHLHDLIVRFFGEVPTECCKCHDCMKDMKRGEQTRLEDINENPNATTCGLEKACPCGSQKIRERSE